MDRRAAGALLALAACFACSAAAPTASNQTALDLYEGTTEGCYYNFQHYGEGDRIMTNEPCLNCTCHNRMLMCYLRVCPFTKAIGQDCTVEKRADQCCPIVTCPDVPVDLLTSTSTTSPAEYGATGLGKLDKYGCSISGKYFPEGSKVPPTPNKPCEHCYCIRNMTTCVMQECTLHVDGCTPIYHKDVCCPVRYSCDHPEDELPLLDDMSTTVRPTPGFLLTTTTISPVTQMTQDCVHDDRVFSDGALIKTEKACEHCYCMKGDIVCVVQECGAPMENEGKNCTSLPPREGQCCPDTYICEGDELTSEISTESTTESIIEKLTTLSPPRRTSIEGSGYRNEPDEAPYTDMPIIEPEVEGSGEEETSKPLGPNEIIPTPGDDEQYIYVTTKGPAYEEPEKTTVAIDKNIIPDIKDKTDEPHVSTNAPTSDLDEKLTTSYEEGILEPHKHVSTTKAPEIYESATTELGDSQNTVPDVIPDEEIGKPNEYAQGTTFAPSSEMETTPFEGEDDKLITTHKEQDGTMSATSKPEYSSTSSNTLTEIEKETALPNVVTNVTPEAVTEKEYFDGGIIKTTTAASVEKQDKETSKPEELVPMTTSTPAEEEKGSLETEQHTPATTNNELEEGVKQTTEPDHAQNTVAVSEDDNTHPHSHISITTVSPTVEQESTTVIKLEQGESTDKVMKEDVPAPTDHATTIVSVEKDSEFTTAEPDRGLNTIPSEIYDESSSEPSLPGRITLSGETKETEPSVITDETQTQGVDTKSTPASEVTTPQPEIIVTKGDQFTVTTEPSFRKEDEGVVSTVKPKEIEPTTIKAEFVDEGLIPTSPHDDKIDTVSNVPTVEEEFTTLIPEYITEIAETMVPKQTTTEASKESSLVTEALLEKTSEPSSGQDGDLPSSTETVTEITPIIEIHEEPSRIPGEGDCLLNGVTYKNNTVVPSTNNCHTGCRCASSIIKCDPIICSPAPDYMDNCQSIYDSPDSCCPTFVCDHPRETAPPQSDNQMSGTESPIPSPTIECRGDQCDISEPTKQPLGPHEPTADDHKTETECRSDGCGDLSQKPDTSVASVEHTNECLGGKCKTGSCTNGECQSPQTQVSPVTPCEGGHCKKIDGIVSEPPQQCKNGEDCKKLEIPTGEIAPCEGESCNKIDCGINGCSPNIIASPPDHQLESCKEEDGCKPVTECTGDEPCRRKETSTNEVKPPATCEGLSCVNEKETTLAQGVIDLSTELPKTEQTPFEEVTEKILPDEGEKTTQPDDHITKPVEEKKPIEDTQVTDTYTTESLTIEGVTSPAIHKEQPVTEDEDTKLTTSDLEKETETTVTTEEDGKEKPISEKEITMKPTMIEKVGTETPDVTEEETTKPSMLGEDGEKVTAIDEEKGTEKPTFIEDKGNDEPTLVGDEGKEKLDISEKESTELPTVDGEEGTTKSDVYDKVKPIVDDSTNKPATSDTDDKIKPVIDVETTEKTAIDDDHEQKPVIDKESTEQPAVVDEGDKEKPVVDEESTKQPATVDEEDKEKNVVDEESTKQPVTVYQGEKEKPMFDGDSTKQPPTDHENDTEKPMLGEDKTEPPVVIEDEDKEKPMVDGESTKRPVIVDEDDKEKPMVDEESTKLPALDSEDEKEKPMIDEETTKKLDIAVEGTTESIVTEEKVTAEPGTGDKATDAPVIVDLASTDIPAISTDTEPSVVGENGSDVEVEKEETHKPPVMEHDIEKPTITDDEEKLTDIDVKDTSKPGQELAVEIASDKPETEGEGTDKPTVDEGSTEIPNIIKEETTSKAGLTDKDEKIKPGHGEDELTEKPIDIEENVTETPAMIIEDSHVTPTVTDEDGKEKPAIIEEDGTEKPMSEDNNKPTVVFVHGDTEKPTGFDKEVTEIPFVEEDGQTEPAVIDQESTEKSVTSDVSKPEKSPEIEEEHKDRPDAFEGSTVGPTLIDDEKSSEKPDIEESTEVPAIIDNDIKKPALVDEGDKEKPNVVETENTKKPSDIDTEVTELSVSISEETTEKPVITNEEGITKSDTEVDTMKPFIIKEESTVVSEINEMEFTAKPVIIDENTEEPNIVEKEDPKKPEKEGTELPVVDGEEDTEKPSVNDEDTKEKHDLADQESTKKPADIEDGTEESVVPEDGMEEPSVPLREGTEKPTLIDEDSNMKPFDEKDSKKPIPVEPVVNKDEDKPSIIDEEVTDKSAENEELSTEEPKTHEKEGSDSETTSEPEKEMKLPETTVQPTDALIIETVKSTKMPSSESQTTASYDIVTSPQETPEIKVTEGEDSYSKEPVIDDHTHSPEITTESMSGQELTTKKSMPDQEKIEVTTYKIDTINVNQEGSTAEQNLISEEPELITKSPELHKTSEPEQITEAGLINKEVDVSTDFSEIGSPTTTAPDASSVKIEPQEGLEPEKPEPHVTNKFEEESTTKAYEEDKIKPLPESHATEATSPESDEVTDTLEITDENKPKPELPEPHGPELEDKTTQVTIVEINTDHPEIHSSEKEESITETPEYSVTEPVQRFTEIEDPSVTGQEDITPGYTEETPEHHLPSGTEKIDESGDVSIASSEKPMLTDMDSELPEKSTETDKLVTKLPAQDYQTTEAEKEKTDEFESPATEVPISAATESQPISVVTGSEEKATTSPDLSDDKHEGTTSPVEYTEKQEDAMDNTQHHVITTEDGHKATAPHVIEPQVTESQETSTKSVEPEKEEEAETTTPKQMHTESYDVDKKEPAITETQKMSTDMPIEDIRTEIPGVQISSEVPQSLVTEPNEILEEQTTVPSILKEESSLKPELPTTQSEEVTKAPEKHAQDENLTEAPVDATVPVEISNKDTTQEVTHVSEDVTEKQDTATTLREPPVEIEDIEITKSTEHPSAQTEVSETTPYLIELEEHTHKIEQDRTTISPSAEKDTSKSPSEEEHSQKPLEDITTSSPSEEEPSQKPVEDISTSPPSEDEHSEKPIDDISTKGEDMQKPEQDISTSSPSEVEISHKPVEDISTSSSLGEKPTTAKPEAGEEPQVMEFTTKKADEGIETATKEAEGTKKPSEESLHEEVSEKVSVPVEETTPAFIHSEDDKDAADHKKFTTVAPGQITEESTPVIGTEFEKLPSSESDIVPTEKEVSTSEKPSHPIISHENTVPEEEFMFTTTKATTIRQEEDMATPVSDDKVVKPEEKPSETSEVPPSSTTAEVSKPSSADLQPTDEIPIPDDDGHFPPSGTSGYGEPDYVEEDQAFGPGTCRYGGKVYVSAQQIPRDDPCDFCFCFRSDIICLQQSCPPPIHGCHEEPIQGFCCPRYECPVSMATTVNVTTTTTTTTTTLPPHFPTHSYKGQAQRRGCQIKGHTYKVGEVVRSSSGPCLHCTCGGDGQMKCDPKACTPEPMLRQMIAAAVSAKRRR